MNRLSLYELTSMVSRAVAEALPDEYWVETEVMSVQERNGHCFMQLAQKDIYGSTVVAQASAKCWRSSWARVNAKFQRTTGTLLSPGMKILALVTVTFHPAYSFSLIVGDIDPTYTLGDMARRRQEIIAQLKAEGVYDLQRELSLPLFPQRVAVISSPGAAGYGDFRNQLENNGYGFHFDAVLFPAVMQGEQVESSVCAALEKVYACHEAEPFACVVIIRGGGAVSDLSGFDTLRLAEHVANFPIPVITGIGHDRDESILDLVSFRKVKTPTAAAAFLIDRLLEVQGRIEAAQDRLVSAVKLRMEMETARVARVTDRITSSMRLFKTRQTARLDTLDIRLANGVKHTLMQQQYRLQLLEKTIESMNPEVLLNRGYSITSVDGRVVKDASQLKDGQVMETRLKRGIVRSVVKKQ